MIGRCLARLWGIGVMFCCCPLVFGDTLVNTYNNALPEGNGTANIIVTSDSAMAGDEYNYGPYNSVDGNFLGNLNPNLPTGGHLSNCDPEEPPPVQPEGTPNQNEWGCFGDEGGVLQADGFYGHTTNPDTYVWAAGFAYTASRWIAYTFDEALDLTTMRLWNFNEITPGTGAYQTDRSMQDVNLWTSNAETFPTPSGQDFAGAGWNLEKAVVLSRASGDGNYTGETVELDFTARHVLLDVESNHGDGPPFLLVGVSEVQFFQADGATLNPADFNQDGLVDPTDFAILAGNWLTAVSGSEQGDANGDGFVDPTDFAVLAGNWLAGVGSFSGSAVPEPSTAVLFLLAVLGFVGYRCRRS